MRKKLDPRCIPLLFLGLISCNNGEEEPEGPMTLDIFLQTCPLDDPVTAEILEDFEFYVDWQPVTNFDCTPDYPSVSFDDLTDPLVYLQTVRVIKYIDELNDSPLPWTVFGLYDWLVGGVDGINFVTNLGPAGRCCGWKQNKRLIEIKPQDQRSRVYDLHAIGILHNIGFLMHERRHADPTNYLHSSCCPRGELACDEEYDPDDVGSYGITLWFYESILKGDLDVGLACLPEYRKTQLTESILESAKHLSSAFCVPPSNPVRTEDVFVEACTP